MDGSDQFDEIGGPVVGRSGVIAPLLELQLVVGGLVGAVGGLDHRVENVHVDRRPASGLDGLPPLPHRTPLPRHEIRDDGSVPREPLERHDMLDDRSKERSGL